MLRKDLEAMLYDAKKKLEDSTNKFLLVRNIRLVSVGLNHYRVSLKVVYHETETKLYVPMANITYDFDLANLTREVVQQNINSSFVELCLEHLPRIAKHIKKDTTLCQKIQEQAKWYVV